MFLKTRVLSFNAPTSLWRSNSTKWPFIFPTFQGARMRGLSRYFASFHITETWKGKTAAPISSDFKTQKKILKISQCWNTSACFTFQDKVPSKFCADHEIICHGRTLSHPGENPKAYSFLLYMHLDIPHLKHPPPPPPPFTHIYLFYWAAAIPRVTRSFASKAAQASRAGFPSSSPGDSTSSSLLPGGPHPHHRHQVSEKVTF